MISSTKRVTFPQKYPPHNLFKIFFIRCNENLMYFLSDDWIKELFIFKIKNPFYQSFSFHEFVIVAFPWTFFVCFIFEEARNQIHDVINIRAVKRYFEKELLFCRCWLLLVNTVWWTSNLFLLQSKYLNKSKPYQSKQ